MVDSPRTVEEALAFARAEHEHETEDWTNFCQRFVRTCYGIPALFSSAFTQWEGADPEDRHAGGNPADAPLGSALCYKGSGPFGHIMLAARPAGDVPGAWSNDLTRTGDIDWSARTAPTAKWGQLYLGYLTAVNDFDLQLKEPKPPKPKHTKRYEAIAFAIARLEGAVETAVNLGEKRDAKVIRAELRQLRELYAELRHE